MYQQRGSLVLTDCPSCSASFVVSTITRLLNRGALNTLQRNADALRRWSESNIGKSPFKNTLIYLDISFANGETQRGDDLCRMLP